MFGKRKTKEKKMQIYIKFLTEYSAYDFQYHLLKEFTNTCKIKQITNAADYTYEFTIMQDDYLDFLSVFFKHYKWLNPFSTIITKIKKGIFCL